MSIELLQLSRLHATAERRLSESFTVHCRVGTAELPPPNVCERIRAIVATGDTCVDSGLIFNLPNLEVISLFGAGYEGVDLSTAHKRAIVVTNTPAALTSDVADLAIALWILLARQIVAAEAYLRARKWLTDGPMPLARTASGRRAGILGLGRIGSAVATRCRAMGMSVAYHNRRSMAEVSYCFFSDLAEMAANVDVLFVTCPGGAATHHLVGEKVIDALGPSGSIVNVARGSVVDELALIKALSAGNLNGAALDVFEHEPQVRFELLSLKNVVLTPHIGSSTVEAREGMANQVVDNLLEYFSNQPPTYRIV